MTDNDSPPLVDTLVASEQRLRKLMMEAHHKMFFKCDACSQTTLTGRTIDPNPPLQNLRPPKKETP
jgi:hypothetical protein